MSGSFTAVSKMSVILLKIREILSGKSCPKLFIVSCIFASIQVFSTSTGMIMSNTLHAECHRGVLQTVREISGNCQGISHCLKSGHPEDKQHLHVASGCELYETCKHHQLVLLIQRENSWHQCLQAWCGRRLCSLDRDALISPVDYVNGTYYHMIITQPTPTL